jgi:hypothetical protein
MFGRVASTVADRVEFVADMLPCFLTGLVIESNSGSHTMTVRLG